MMIIQRLLKASQSAYMPSKHLLLKIKVERQILSTWMVQHQVALLVLTLEWLPHQPQLSHPQVQPPRKSTVL
jgi:hypothetical protein